MLTRYVLSALLLLGACGDDDAQNDGGTSPRRDAALPDVPAADGGSVAVDPMEWTYRLEESSDALALWTTPVARKIVEGQDAPTEARSGLRMSAARGEFEPVQLVLDGSGSVRVEVEAFASLGAGVRIQVTRVGFDEGMAESLTPVEASDSVGLNDGPTPFWITLRVPRSAPPGEHETTIRITPDGGSPISIPLRLYVFDFELPEEIHFASQLNIGISEFADALGSVDEAKTFLFEHRFTPKSVTWPSGFAWPISWENPRSSDPCGVLWDEPDEGERFSIGQLAPRYILGEGWNDVGFPNAMLFQFVDNSTPRPSSFCGIERGDHVGSAAYNAEWSEYLQALDAYLVEHGLAERAYYYVQNEPQDADDHALAAHLCRLTRAAAPNLRIAVSEEPRPEIAEDPGGACGYDIWIAHLPAYEQSYAWERQRDFGEQVWFYSLDQDADPYPNPTQIDRQGMHQRILPWIAWGQRIDGWAYYDFGRFFDGAQPGVRAELFREGFEDYEYLWLANGGARPEAFGASAVDPTIRSVASSLTSWLRDPDALMTVRHELGRFIEGSRSTVPVFEAETTRPRGAYYLNFQDPSGQPVADPLVVDGNTYIKIGWGAWDDERAWGWLGENVGNPAITLFGWDGDGGSVLERSYVYDDYGRRNLFEFALAPGRYSVTLGVGRPARGYPGDPHNATVEGRVVVEDEPTSDAMPLIRRTVEVDVSDGRLSLEVGGRSETTGDFAYTFVGYVNIEPIDE